MQSTETTMVLITDVQITIISKSVYNMIYI